MILVIGGAYMGKYSWAKEKFDIGNEDTCELERGYVSGKKCYRHLEALTRSDMEQKLAAGEEIFCSCGAVDRLIDENPDAVIIAREAGCGVVPTDPGDRAWREYHGAQLQKAAARAGRVYRIFCGLPEELK